MVSRTKIGLYYLFHYLYSLVTVWKYSWASIPCPSDCWKFVRDQPDLGSPLVSFHSTCSRAFLTCTVLCVLMWSPPLHNYFLLGHCCCRLPKLFSAGLLLLPSAEIIFCWVVAAVCQTFFVYLLPLPSTKIIFCWVVAATVCQTFFVWSLLLLLPVKIISWWFFAAAVCQTFTLSICCCCRVPTLFSAGSLLLPSAKAKLSLSGCCCCRVSKLFPAGLLLLSSVKLFFCLIVAATVIADAFLFIYLAGLLPAKLLKTLLNSSWSFSIASCLAVKNCGGAKQCHVQKCLLCAEWSAHSFEIAVDVSNAELHFYLLHCQVCILTIR